MTEPRRDHAFTSASQRGIDGQPTFSAGCMMPSFANAYRQLSAMMPAQPPTRVDDGFSAAAIGIALFANALAATVLLRQAGLTIDPWARSTLPYWLAALLAVLLRIALWRRTGRAARALSDAVEYIAIFAVVTLMGVVTSYPVAALTHGYADAALERIDTALRFDWLTWYRVVEQHRFLQWLGVAAYNNIYVTPVALFGWYAWQGERREAHRFLASFWLAAVMTLSLFSLLPAVGPFSFLWHRPITYMPTSELWQPDLIPMLRAHAVHVVDLGHLRGLVSAPSFHAAAGTLYIAASWRMAALRQPLLWTNIAMLLATPVEGTHYAADMILGTIVALVAMAAVNFLSARALRSTGLTIKRRFGRAALA